MRNRSLLAAFALSLMASETAVFADAPTAPPKNEKTKDTKQAEAAIAAAKAKRARKEAKRARLLAKQTGGTT